MPAAISAPTDENADGEQRPVVEPGDGDGDRADDDRQEEGDDAGSHPDDAADGGMKSAITASGLMNRPKPIASSSSPTARIIQVISRLASAASLNIWAAGTLPTSTISSWSPAMV